MSNELMSVLAVLGAATVMFIVGKPRMDAVALLVIVALPLLGLASVSESLVGFSDPNIVLIAALFVVGECWSVPASYFPWAIGSLGLPAGAKRGCWPCSWRPWRCSVRS
ncbi:MAG: hypothetical protein QM775_36825 [Pirellulales bacterium]